MTVERGQAAGTAASGAPDAVGAGAVLRRTAAGWSVGDEDVPDLTSAMVLADLIAAELSDPDPDPEPDGHSATTAGADAAAGARGDRVAAGAAADGGVSASGAAVPDGAGGASPGGSGAGPAAGAADDAGGRDEARRLRVTIGQLEHALAVRIRVEQAIGVLAERHRVRPRQAFEQLRSAARARGRRVIDIAGDVIASATNPLLPLPEELCRPVMAPRQRGRSQRRPRESR
jgi:hypothetical protein